MERWKSTRELTIESVELIQERRVTVAQVARDLGVQETVLSRWVQESAADAQQAFQAGGQNPLRHRVIKLKAERDTFDYIERVYNLRGGTPHRGISVRWSSNGRPNERRMVSTKPAAAHRSSLSPFLTKK